MENYLPNPPWEGWQTVREIGSGSFGTVYEICRTLFNGQTETAAMKLMSLPTKKTEIDKLYRSGYTKERIAANYKEACEKITEEYSLMRKLDGCVNTVNCHDICYFPHTDDIGWDIYIRMELLTPLEDVLTENIPESAVLQLGIDLCKALEMCKKHNIIHRDIKPQNIFISPDGDYKLGDFGIAREMEATENGTAIGTLNYIAPEVVLGRPYGSRADIYSLGIVLYWMLNERVIPFAQKSTTGVGMRGTEEARNRRMAGEALPLPAHGSADLQRVILKACAYNPEDRYASATEMLSDLNKVANGIFKIPDAYQNIGYEEKKDKKRTKNKNKSKTGTTMPKRKKILIAVTVTFVLLAVAFVNWSLKADKNYDTVVGNNNLSSPVDDSFDEETDNRQTDYGSGTDGFVGYDTPNHCGLNVRAEASSNSELLTTLKEGQQLMYYPDSLANGYVYCEFTNSSDVNSGWIMLEYLQDASDNDSLYFTKKACAAYYDVLQNKIENKGVYDVVGICVDIDNDGIPELLFENNGKDTVELYDYNTIFDNAFSAMSHIKGKGSLMDIYYSTEKEQIIAPMVGIVSSGNTFYGCEDTQWSAVKSYLVKDAEFTDTGEDAFLIDDVAVSREEFYASYEKDAAGFLEVDDTEEELLAYLEKNMNQ